MELSLNGFQELDCNQIIAIDGGGPVTIVLATVGLAVSPGVFAACPAAGAGLALTCIGALYDNI